MIDSGAAATLTVSGGGTFGGNISGANTALTKAGSNTLTLSGASTYSGATTINAGTLQAGAANTFSSNSDVTLANTTGPTLDLNSFNESIGSLAGGGTTGGNVTLGGGNLTTGGTNAPTTFSGVISGSGGLVKQGSGTMVLGGANTYTGATTVNAGTLQITGSLANPSIAVNSGAGIEVNGASYTIVGDGTASLTVDVPTNSTATVTSSLVTINSQAVSFTGASDLTINGNAEINNTNVTTSGSQTYLGTVDVVGSAAATLTGSGNITFGGAVFGDPSGPSTLTVSTDGTSAFNGAVGSIQASGTLTTNSNVVSVSTAGLVPGDLVSGTGVPANTTIGSINSNAGTITLSNNATISGVEALTFTAPWPTLTTGGYPAPGMASKGVTQINTGDVTTVGGQTYDNAVVLGANATLTSSGAGAITFAGNVDGPFNLDVNTAGTTTFDGNVGTGAPLMQLTTDQPGQTDLAGTVQTTGNLTINDPLVLLGNVTLIDAGATGAGITLSNPALLSPGTFSVNAGTPLTLTTETNLNVSPFTHSSNVTYNPETLTGLTLTVTSAISTVNVANVGVPVTVGVATDSDFQNVTVTGTPTTPSGVSNGNLTVVSSTPSTTVDLAATTTPVSVTVAPTNSAVTIVGNPVDNTFSMTGTQEGDVTFTGGTGLNVFVPSPTGGFNVTLVDPPGGTNTIDLTNAEVPFLPKTVQTSGTLTDNSSVVTDVSTAGLFVGDLVSGTGVPDSTTIASIPSAGTITLTNNAALSTSTATETLTFTSSQVQELGVSLDLTQNDGQKQLVYQPGVTDPDIGTFIDPSFLTTGSEASLSLVGSFPNVILGSGSQLIAAPSGYNPVSGAPVLGTNVVLMGTNNTVYGAPGATITASSNDNTIIQNFNETQTNAYVGSVLANPASLASLLTTNPSGFGSLLATNPSAFGNLLAANPSAFGSLLSSNPSGFGSILATNPSALGSILTSNASAFGSLLTTNPSAFGSILTTNPSGFASLLQSNATGFGNLLATDATVFGSVLSNGMTISLSNIPSANASLLTSNPSAVASLLANNPSAFGSLLGSSSTGSGSLLSATAAGFGSLLGSNPSAFGSLLATDPSAFGSLLATDPSAFGSLLAANPSAFGSLLATNPSAFGSLLALNPTAFGSLLTSNASAFGSLLATSPSSLGSLLSANPTGLGSLLASSSSGLGSILASSASGLGSLLAASPTGLGSLLASNPSALGSLLSADPSGLGSLLSSNSSGLGSLLTSNSSGLAGLLSVNPSGFASLFATNRSAFGSLLTSSGGLLTPYMGDASILAMNPSAFGSLLTSNATAFASLLTNNPTGFGNILASNPSAFASFLASGASAFGSLLASNPTGFATLLTTSPSALGSLLSTNPSAFGSLLASDPSGFGSILAANPSALGSLLSSNASGLGSLFSTNPSGLGSLLSTSASGLGSFLASTPSAFGSLLASSSSAFGSLLAINPSGLGSLLASNASAFGSLLASSPTAAASLLANSPSAFGSLLSLNASALGSLLATNASAFGSFLATNASAFGNLLATSPSAFGNLLAANPSGFGALLTSNSSALGALLASNSSALGTLLASNPTGLGSLLAADPSGLGSLLGSNASGLGSLLGSNASGLGTLLSSDLGSLLTTNPSALTALLSSNSSALGTLLASNPTGLGGLLASDPSLVNAIFADPANSTYLTTFLNANPSVVTTFALSLTRLNVNLAGTSGNQVTGGLLGSYDIGTGSVFTEDITAGQLALLNQGLAQGVAASTFDLNVTADGGNNTLVGGLMGNFTANGGGNNRFVIEDPSFLIPSGTTLPTQIASSGGTFTGSGGNDTFYFVGGSSVGSSSAYSFGNMTLGETAPTGQDTVDFSNYLGGGVNLNLNDAGPQVITPLMLTLTLPSSPGIADVIGSPAADTIIGNSPSNVLQGSATEPADLSAPASAAVAPANPQTQYVYLDFTTDPTPPTTEPAVTFNAGAGVSLSTSTIKASQNSLVGSAVTGLQTGQAVIYDIGSQGTTASNTPIGGLANDQTYYVIANPKTPTQVQLASSLANAEAGSFIPFTSAGTGTQSLDVAVSESLHDGTGAYTSAEQLAVLQDLTNDYAVFTFGTAATPLVKFTLDPSTIPANTPYETVYFDKTLIFNGTPTPGGYSDEIDFRNLNLDTSMQVDVNGVLGTGAGQIPDTESNFINLTVNVTAHEIGHTMGLQHMDAFDPIGFGISNPPGAGVYYPAYPGQVGAFETQTDIMSSPAAVGTTIAQVASTLETFDERDAVNLAFINGGTVVQGTYTGTDEPNLPGTSQPYTVSAAQSAAASNATSTPTIGLVNEGQLIAAGTAAAPAQTVPASLQATLTQGSNSVSGLSGTTWLFVGEGVSGTGIPTGTTIASIGSGSITLSNPATLSSSETLTFTATVNAQPVSLYSLAVPNPITTGFDAGKTFDVAAVDVLGTLTGTHPDFYTFQGQAGDLMNFETWSKVLTRITNPADTVLYVYGPDGNLLAWDDDQFESSDSSILDLTLPKTGTYTVEVDSYGDATSNPNAAGIAGDYELFMYRFAAYNAPSPSVQDEIYTNTPALSFTATPPTYNNSTYSNSTSASFAFSVSNVSQNSGALDLIYSVDGGSPVTLTGSYMNGTVQGSVTLTGLSQGPHTFEVENLGTNGSVLTSASYSWTIDTTPPTVTLSAEPSFINNTAPTFSGIAGTVPASTSSSADAGTVTVSIYSGTSASGNAVEKLTGTVGFGGSYAVPANPALAEGTYTAQTFQLDGAGNIGFSAATTFTVDTTPPTVSITAEPATYSNTTTATFTSAASDTFATAGPLGFQVSLDGAAFAQATSSVTYSNLNQGSHTFQVEAVDQAGNVSAAASYSWIVDTIPPTVTSITPSNTGNTYSFSFAGTDNITAAMP